ncbi:ribonuclease H2 subunit B isoform X2 [Pectinophora gossypiella]|uniref:ribonuclease H2 subunit B isoform X2 n=1 Tax=Pectinophora gossypiella TaxID=13191 RepID=UPI00214E6FF5|nr:ribonuclease H2 subunit B isoform X2 [Pectinophora gossypiella]
MTSRKSLFENDNFSIITIPHPADGRPAKYCLDNINKKIYEIVTFSEPHRSWFIGETVKSDGGLQMVTPVNPLFIVLPLLKAQCTNRAIPLEGLLSEKGYDKIVDFVSNMEQVADLKGPADLQAYKYNEEKTLKWLEERVCRLAKVLREKNIHVTSGAVSATFVASNLNNDNVDDEFYLKYAHGLVSEYLQEDLADLLEKRFDFKPDLVETVGKKRKSEASDLSNTNKKIKQEPSGDESIENILNTSNGFSEVKKQKPLTAKEKARQKAASGTKTISAFFAKK